MRVSRSNARFPRELVRSKGRGHNSCFANSYVSLFIRNFPNDNSVILAVNIARAPKKELVFYRRQIGW